METFLECVVAPSYAEEALELLRGKKNLRVLATGAWLEAAHRELTWKRVGGGIVVQERDATGAGEVRAGRVVTQRAPTEEEIEGLDLAWKVTRTSRLACQIVLTDELGSLSVRMPGGSVDWS